VVTAAAVVVVVVAVAVAFVVQSVFIYVLNQHLSCQSEGRNKSKIATTTNQEHSQDKKSELKH
jgi:phosphotransferase system  glucose/maltose/N-acetylglucosamine-specific IIC component